MDKTPQIPKPLQGLIEPIYEIEGGPSPLGYYTTGHVDKEEFVAGVKAEYSEPIQICDVKHGHARNVPLGRDRPGEMAMYFCEKGRGAYTVTHISFI